MSIELPHTMTPRRLRLRAAGWAISVFSFVMFAFAAVVALVAYQDRVQYEMLRVQGIEGKAIITRKVNNSTVRGTHLSVSYSMVVDGRTYSRTVSVGALAYDEMREGQQVPALYLQSDPSVNWLIAEAAPLEPSAITMIAAVPLLVALAALVPLWRQRRLLRNGEATAAVVTGLHRQGVRQYIFDQLGAGYVNYRFRDNAGREHIGSSSFSDDSVPPVGGTVAVIYSRENPVRNTAVPTILLRFAEDTPGH